VQHSERSCSGSMTVVVVYSSCSYSRVYLHGSYISMVVKKLGHCWILLHVLSSLEITSCLTKHLVSIIAGFFTLF